MFVKRVQEGILLENNFALLLEGTSKYLCSHFLKSAPQKDKNSQIFRLEPVLTNGTGYFLFLSKVDKNEFQQVFL